MSDRLAAQVSAGLSVFLSVWGLLFVDAWGRWRQAALIGIALAGLALVVFAVLVALSVGLS